jgi:hydrogenase small subunit
MALLNTDIHRLLGLLDVTVLWHPSLSNGSAREHTALQDAILAGSQPLDVLVVEGAVIRGPGGTGMFDTVRGLPKKDLVAGLARRAGVVVAAGTCASFGGIGAAGEVEACGLQFLQHDQGGFLGADFVSAAGLPVINLPGCPCHTDVLTGALTALASGVPVELNEYNSPAEWYASLVHQGCTRNEYHEYRIEEREFGEKGCLFFYLGCRGPIAHGPCNKALWNGRNSKTRAGIPCFGCTQPDFPQAHPFFQTPSIAEIPLELPEGVDRAHYMAYKAMAAAAAPERLTARRTRV